MRDPMQYFEDDRDSLEDFWGRKENRGVFQKTIHVFGRKIEITSNHEVVLEAADLSQMLYANAAPTEEPPFHVQWIVREGAWLDEPVPDHLLENMLYTGDGHWIHIQAVGRGQISVDMHNGLARGVLSPQLAERPDLVSRYFMNTVINNLMTRNGFSMLHASGLAYEGRVLLLMAPHGSGKSTTALHLLQAGYSLISDSQIYLVRRPEGLALGGFPVGQIKLRQDMLPRFPQFEAGLMEERVRAETKYVVDLRRYAPEAVVGEMLRPEAVEFCLLRLPTASERAVELPSELLPLDQTEVLEAVIQNSLHYDTDEVWQNNLQPILELLDSARLHELTIGSDPQDIVDTVNELWTRR